MKKVLILMLLIAGSSNAAELKQGSFTCDAGGSYDSVKLSVKQHPTKYSKAILNWEGKDRIVHRESSTSGAVRYVGAVSNLLYIQTPHHSVLLDDSTKRVILSECMK